MNAFVAFYSGWIRYDEKGYYVGGSKMRPCVICRPYILVMNFIKYCNNQRTIISGPYYTGIPFQAYRDLPCCVEETKTSNSKLQIAWQLVSFELPI